MSSLSSSVSSASSNPATTHTHARQAFSGPERAATRPHANSYSVVGIGEAGPSSSSSFPSVSDRRAERRRSTLSGSDRKRRLVHDGESAWLRRAGSGDGMEAGPSRRPSDGNSRSISSGSSSHARREAPLPGASYATAIDLSSSSPPPHHHHPPPGERRSSWSRTGSNYLEYIRPRWQPDTEVTECPICGVPFSFWYRKHHCRKCGRVVCSSCSPHRITIPRQFIVRPPDSHRSSVAPLVPPRAAQLFDTDLSPNAAINPALGGGEEVRLCNPCVPDPNPDPPRGYGLRSCPGQPNQSRHRSYHSLSIPSRPSYSATHDTFPSRPGRRTVGSNDYSATFASLGGSLGSRLSERPMEYGSMSGRVPPWMGAPPHAVYPSQRPGLPPPAPLSYGMHSASQDRRRVHERDLCPICDHELPPLGADGNEDTREAHIRGCIESHGRQTRSPSQSGSPVSQPVFPVRMLAFTATEKDCLGHDGATQECTICMEDYEVGQSLVRLECLCKFHKRCIVEWFERKKECPVHKVS